MSKGRDGKERKSDGAFFTTPIAARLMATLIFTVDLIDWSDPAQVAKIRVIDPSCGDGRLLAASKEVIEQRVRNAGGTIPVKFYQQFEGYDIHPPSVQAAQERIAGDADPTTAKIACLPHGPQHNGNVRSGALDILLHPELNKFDDIVDKLCEEEPEEPQQGNLFNTQEEKNVWQS